MSSPRVSVLMPIYNAAPYLAAALESVLSQSFADFELIIVNDGSTDASSTIAQHYADNDGRVRLMNLSNGGIVQALNAGLENCNGHYIARMDGDDLCLPERFEKQIAHLERNSSVVALGCGATLIDPNGNPFGELVFPVDHQGIVKSLLASSGGLTHPSAMIRAEPLKRLRYRRECCYAEDLDLYLRLAREGELANLAEQLLMYRRHPGAVGNRLARAHACAAFRAIRDAKVEGADVSRTQLAAHAYRASWNCSQERKYGLAIYYAAEAFILSPSSSWWFRSLMRVLLQSTGARRYN